MAQPTGVLFLLLVSAVSLASGRVLRDTFAGAQRLTCGLRPVKPSLDGERIVNGHTPKYGSYPWQAGIYAVIQGQLTFICGGIIIDDDWILSAAHCFLFSNPSTVKIHVGDHNRMKKDPSEQIFKVGRLYLHEDYGIPPYDNDIALVKLQPNNGKVIQFDDNVQPACLPTPDTLYTADKKCLISGWGMTDPAQVEATALLQAAEVPLLSHSQCKEELRKYGLDETLTSNMVCSGPVDPFGGICRGDSGGPLVYKEKVGYTVLGITSWGFTETCGTYGEPGVFVKVNQYLPWIQAKMGT